MKSYERLLKYAAIYTTSDEHSESRPTSACQLDLAHSLASEMTELGIKDVRVSEQGYVYGILPATAGNEGKPSLGFIAHMDTSPDAKGEHVKPQVIENYQGEDVVLQGNSSILSPEMFPHLHALKGRTLITTDGTTLLGADDKAGIAEIMTACEIIQTEQLPHAGICIGFTPDEEVGNGADWFDVKNFGADFAYTMDGGQEGELEYENFNAAEAVLEINGIAVHPGTAKNTMVNALTVACEINSLIPGAETPAHTEEYEGFYHLRRLEGGIDHVSMEYSLRDHDSSLLSSRKNTLQQAVKIMNEKYGANTVSLTITDRYKNMADIIKNNFHLVENAILAIESVGVKPIVIPMRGGTDGAALSYKGLPCPNLGTGGYAYHGIFEHITAEGMDQCVQIIIALVKCYARDIITA